MGNPILQLVEAEAPRGNLLKAPPPKKQVSVGDEKESHNPGAVPRGENIYAIGKSSNVQLKIIPGGPNCGLGLVCHRYKQLEQGLKYLLPTATPHPSTPQCRNHQERQPQDKPAAGKAQGAPWQVTADLFNHHPVIELIRLRALDTGLLSHLEWFYNPRNSSQKANCQRRESRNKHNSSLGDSAYGWVTTGHLGVIDGLRLILIFGPDTWGW